VSEKTRGATMIRTATVCASIFVAASLVPGIPDARAQTVPTPPPAAAPASPQDAAEQRVRSLQAELHIIDAQMPQWSAFAQTMLENATSTDTLFRQRASTAQSMNAVDNMRSYAQVARAYADNTEKLSAAFEALYGVLSDQQRQTIDTLFRQQPAQSVGTQPVRR
jgi:periplasmic protein CpxP/Spy